jgi:hypothetical protein
MRSSVSTARLSVAIALTAIAAGVSIGQEKNVNTRVYELRTYTTLPGRLPALNKRFAEHTLKLFEKHGMKNEMYWVPDGEDNKLIYVVSHASREAADKSWKDFGADPDWQKVRAESEKDGKIVEKVERVWMKQTDYSPNK